MLRELAMKSKADVVLIEVGGTIGDFENMYVLEAIRELIYEEGKENVAVVNLTYILEPNSLGEQKSKAAQLGIKKMKEMGLSPDIIVCRSENPITKTIKEKVSLFSSVPMNRVIGLHDLKEFYRIPLTLREKGLDEEVCRLVGLKKFKPKDKGNALKKWTKKMTVEKAKKTISIGIAGKYTGLRDSYISILKALEHCEAEFNCKIKVKWIETREIENGKKKVSEAFKGINGLIVPGGFGKHGIEGKISCIKHAREKNIPFLGLCLGFQLALIEFARNVLGLKKANSTEFDSSTPEPVIDLLPEQKKIEGLGGTMRLGGRNVEVKKGTKAFKLYGKTLIRERFRHRFECNPDYIERFESTGIVFSGKAPKAPIMQILEFNKNRFFLATQFHPEFTSRPLKPNPCFKGFVEACLK
jgi:CTP synthase